jgi:hypothetical protein
VSARVPLREHRVFSAAELCFAIPLLLLLLEPYIGKMEFFTLGNGMVTTSSKNCLSASLFKKGLIEKPCNGVINRLNSCAQEG